MKNTSWAELLNQKYKRFNHSIDFRDNQNYIYIDDNEIKFLNTKNNFVVSPDKWLKEKITKEDIHEPRLISWLFAFSNVFREKKIRFYDIGALFGFHSFIFSKISNYSKIVAVEGNPLSAKYIEENVENNKLKNFDVINCVVDLENGKKNFLIDAFSFQKNKKSKIKYFFKRKLKYSLNKLLQFLNLNIKINEKKIIEKIQTKTLDSIMLPHHENEIEIIKIDTEGHQAIFLPQSIENLISRNAIVLLELDDPVLMESFNSSNNQLVKPFVDNGYHAFWTQHRDKNSDVIQINEIQSGYDCNSLVTLIPQKFI